MSCLPSQCIREPPEKDRDISADRAKDYVQIPFESSFQSKRRRYLWIEFYQNPTLQATTWRETTDEVAAAKRSDKAEHSVSKEDSVL